MVGLDGVASAGVVVSGRCGLVFGVGLIMTAGVIPGCSGVRMPLQAVISKQKQTTDSG